jgi:uncharacterized protein YaiI (UPF0178 family)
MLVYIDADACPVTRLAVRLAKARAAAVTLVCDCAHTFDLDGVQNVVVEKGADSADFALLKRIRPGDIVVTQDYALAALCLALRARPINQDGRLYSDENITGLLTSRHERRKVRRAGGRVRGPKARTPQQDQRFEQAFVRLLEQTPEELEK